MADNREAERPVITSRGAGETALVARDPTRLPAAPPIPLSGDPRALYVGHFGLAEAPFSLTPDPRYVYMSERHREALAHLLYGVREGGSVVQLTGEVGTGKTTLCRCLLEQLPPEVDVALILNPRLTAPELLATVCDELGVAYPPGTTSVKLLVDAFYRHLLDAHARGRRTVLIIDEAQNLTAGVLEQVRLLTNLETAKEKLLQIILIGQPELARLLGRQRLRQLAQRVTARYHLLPFSRQETLAYIRHRLGVGGRKTPLFSPAALREVHRQSGGIPRLLNVICDRALLGAYAHDRDHVDTAAVRRAAREVLGRAGLRFAHAGIWAAAAAGLVIAATAAWFALVAAPVAGRSAGRPDGPRPTAKEPPTVARAREAPAPVAVVDTSEPAPPTAAAVGRGTDATATATPTPARAEPSSARLSDVLADPSLKSDKRSSFARLHALWGLDEKDAGGALGCERGRQSGLACLFRTGTWKKLRRFDLPAIIELVAPSGARHYATVAALDDARVTLEFGERRLSVPLAEVEPFWDGSFILLWKPPALNAIPIVPGARGRDVAWLRQRLGEVDGLRAVSASREAYDDDLRQRVVAFQRGRSLVPDGVVAEETLTHLARALAEPGIPSLSRSRP